MPAAKNITFKIIEDGNGYGRLFGEFGEGDNKRIVEFGLVYSCDEDIAATLISMIGSYEPQDDIKEQVGLMVAESKMRLAIHRFNELKKQSNRK